MREPIFQFEKERILYEDDGLLIYNKPPFICSPSLASFLKLFLVHRLDRDTTGVLILAKNPAAQAAMEKLFKQRKIEKEYHAIVKGFFPEKKVVEGEMALLKRREGAVLWGLLPSRARGLWSKTSFKRLSSGKELAYLSCHPITGRTHQIRVHLKSLGSPILGDVEYGGRVQPEGVFRPLLHSSQISFIHPIKNRRIEVEAPLPEDLLMFTQKLN